MHLTISFIDRILWPQCRLVRDELGIEESGKKAVLRSEIEKKKASKVELRSRTLYSTLTHLDSHLSPIWTN